MNGKQQPGPAVMLKLAEAHYNLNWLLTGNGGMYLSEGTDVPPEIMTMAKKLALYPEIVSTLHEAIELREKFERAKQELKTELQRKKKK